MPSAARTQGVGAALVGTCVSSSVSGVSFVSPTGSRERSTRVLSQGLSRSTRTCATCRGSAEACGPHCMRHSTPTSADRVSRPRGWSRMSSGRPHGPPPPAAAAAVAAPLLWLPSREPSPRPLLGSAAIALQLNARRSLRLSRARLVWPCSTPSRPCASRPTAIKSRAQLCAAMRASVAASALTVWQGGQPAAALECGDGRAAAAAAARAVLAGTAARDGRGGDARRRDAHVAGIRLV